MIKSKLFVAISLIFIGLSFSSCDDEPIDPALLPLLNPTNAGGCEGPALFEASDFVGGTNVNLSWTAATGTSTWQIQYGLQGFAVGSGTQITATDTEVTVSGLVSTNNYEFYIRTVCGANSYSSWKGPISVGGSIGSCPDPISPTAVRSAANTEITVSWTSGGSAVSWQVQYGAEGFALGTGTITPTTSPTKTITGVLANTAYDIYVRSNCSSTDNSSWVGPVHVDAVGTIISDYWPTTIGNQWVWSIGGVDQEPFAIVSTNVVNGFNYFTFTTPAQPNTATTRIRKSGGLYYIKTEQITHVTPLPGVTTGNEVIILKDNVPVGTTWTDSFVQTTTYDGMAPIALNMSITCTIEAKGVSATVNGTTYNDVIKVKRVTTANTDVYNGEYWFAKNVGPIKVVNAGTVQELESYIIN